MNKSNISVIHLIIELSKAKITVAVSLTTVTGYVLAGGGIQYALPAVTIGIFFMACGASVLNHIQEARSDALMERTQDRPIPAGKVTVFQASSLALSELLIGSVILYSGTTPKALILAWFAMVWYNLIYTYLKRITPHAVIPGSVVGAIPPLVGWVAAGSFLNDVRAWALAFFFFVWQVPHFYLLVIKYGSQYQKAGLPALTGKYSIFLIRFIIFLWIVTTGTAAMFLFYFGVIHSFIAVAGIFSASVWLIIIFMIPVVRPQSEFKPFYYFMRINYYVLFVIILMNLDRFLFHYLI
jgi:protoheme IX farnesyltransferase